MGDQYDAYRLTLSRDRDGVPVNVVGMYLVEHIANDVHS
jgi:hypothetical protein